MNTTRTLFAMSLCGAMLSLVACGLGTQQDVSQPTHAVTPKAMSASWVTAPQKHNNAGIELRYRLLGKPQVGQALQVQLEFSGATQDDAGAQMRVDKALSVAADSVSKMNPTAAGYAMSLSKVQPTSQTLTITPRSEGMHYIYFQLGQAGRQSAVSIAVPVGDGPFATPTTGQAQTLPSGEKIIVMPAQ